MTVYIITSGRYESYCIEHVFLDHDKAKECAQYIPDSEIEEYEITETVPKRFLRVRMETTIKNKAGGNFSPKVTVQTCLYESDTEWCWEQWNHSLVVGMVRCFPAEEYYEHTAIDLCQKEFKSLVTDAYNLWLSGLKDSEIKERLQKKSEIISRIKGD